MDTRRRDFLAGCAALAATGFGSRPVRAADKAPVLGLIFPPLDRGVPDEGIAMYGDTLKYVVTFPPHKDNHAGAARLATSPYRG